MMKAIRKAERAPGLTLQEVPVPRPGNDEVRVRVEAASICGTDLHIYLWDEWSQHRIVPPLTIGHEFAGTVVDVGKDVRHVRAGDYVSAESHITCGMCFQCRTGQAHMCEQTRILGVDQDGVFAEYAMVPEAVIWKNDRSKLPPEIATLQEPFGNAVFATSVQDLAGRSVAVLGCGPIGLFTIGIARASGAAGVWGADRTPFRLELAKRMGARDVVNVQDTKDIPAWFREQNEGYGLDVVFEMSGSPRAITDAFKIVRNGGRVILFGIPSRPVEIDVAEALIFKNLNVLALNGRKIFETWYKTRWMLESGVVDLRPLITHRYPLDDIDTAMRQLQAGEACKIILIPGKEASQAAFSSLESAAGFRDTPEMERVREPAGPRVRPKWTH
ncbi:MAG: L-threonine 3-dehydrogenase [Armatimonadetes bacterium]|nr:L-threonine 3-dehydrogenase [Armatimonadota bacterium]